MNVFMLLVSLLLSSTLNQVQTASNPSTLRSKLTKVSVESDNKIISNYTGWLSPDDTLCMDIYVKETIISLRTTITVKYRVEDSVNYLTLLNYDVDTCKSIKDLMQSGLTNIWFRNMRKYGNLSSGCPVRPGYYNLRDFQLDSKSIPVFLRSGLYRFKVLSYNGKANTNANFNSNNKVKTRRLISSFTVDMKLY